MNGEIRILIADDHPIVRKGLRQVIESDAALKVIDEAGDGATALRRTLELAPDVAILDLDMPGLSGFDVAREIQKQCPRVGVIILTIHGEADMFNEAMDIGVKGYILKDSVITEIINAVKAIAGGQPYISPTLSAHLMNRRARADELTNEKPNLSLLTPTERRILKMIAEDKTSKEIAAELFVHYRTIENHRTNISQKLNLRGSHALWKFALKHKSELS